MPAAGRTSARFWIPAGAALALAFGVACCASWGLPPPTYASEEPVASGSWTAIDGVPAWVTSPPPRDGHLVFVVEGKSNLRGIAAGPGCPFGAHEARRRVTAALTPVVGSGEAALAAEAAIPALRMTRRACKEELLTREMVVGNTLCTAWALWEVPLDAVVAPLPPDRRESARQALAGAR